jgi:uncharacterized membrane protein SpoIIM required for sporulation
MDHLGHNHQYKCKESITIYISCVFCFCFCICLLFVVLWFCFVFVFVFVFVICFCLLYEIDREKKPNFQTQTKYFGNSHEIKLSYFTDFTNNILPRLTTTVNTTRLSVLTTNYTRQINVL